MSDDRIGNVYSIEERYCTTKVATTSIPLSRPWATICHVPSGASDGAIHPQPAWPSGPACARPSICAACTRPFGRLSQTLICSLARKPAAEKMNRAPGAALVGETANCACGLAVLGSIETEIVRSTSLFDPRTTICQAPGVASVGDVQLPSIRPSGPAVFGLLTFGCFSSP